VLPFLVVGRVARLSRKQTRRVHRRVVPCCEGSCVGAMRTTIRSLRPGLRTLASPVSVNEASRLGYCLRP
jgi:hypothetical protein